MSTANYYVPAQSKWPIITALAIGLFLYGFALMLYNSASGAAGQSSSIVSIGMFTIGALGLIYVFFGWFGNVIQESNLGLYSKQMDDSFRISMVWFIFTEIMFFAAFFGALFYTRYLALPWIAAEGHKAMNFLLWPNFIAGWPLFENPDNTLFKAPSGIIDPFRLPLINTILLLTSSFTLSYAHNALKENKRNSVIPWLGLTVILGVVFLYLQGTEYVHAYRDLGLTLDSGVYGSIFFLLTGFHGLHVTIGTIGLFVILMRIIKGHFNKDNHFGFEAVSWYWHFVDVVWLLLFVSVYIL